MVRLWAEKEMRNLTRMHSAGLPVPQPILLRSHVLMMSFIGKDGWPAPKLKVIMIHLVWINYCHCICNFILTGCPYNVF